MANLVFTLPDLGEGLTEAALVQWIVAVGDHVSVDQPIAEVETAKSVVELPSPFEGVVAVLHGNEGDTINVGSPFMEVASTSVPSAPDAAPPAAAASASNTVEVEAYREEERAGSGNVLIGYGTTERRGGRRTRRRANAVASAAGSAPASVPRTAPRPPEHSTGPVAVRSPIVRNLARDQGVDLRSVHAAAPDGIIRRADVLDAAAPSMAPVTPAASGPPTPAPMGLDVVRREPLGMLRKAVSAKMTRSHAEIPEATVWVDVDATDLWDLRHSMGDHRPSITAMVARFALLALADFPVLAGRLSDDGTEIIGYDGINLGVAANTDRGLLVPVIRHAERASIAALDTEIRRLADAARSGTATPADLTGSTFTLNNYGTLGVDGSAAIINHPEVAILGMGRMLERPWVVAGAIVPRRIMQLSLVFDHRVCDGGYAAGFLRQVVDTIERPAALFARV